MYLYTCIITTPPPSFVLSTVWPVKSRQMSIKVAKKIKILTPLQKLPKNVGDLGKIVVTKGFEKMPKVQ